MRFESGCSSAASGRASDTAVRMHPHGVMFHHFHGGNHPASQGSISIDQLDRIIGDLKARYRLLDADHFLEKAVAGSLHTSDICLTFDDALLCQVELAAPVLQHQRV